MASEAPTQQDFNPNALRAVLAGAGADLMGEPSVVDAVLALVQRGEGEDIEVCYLGTATYDLPAPMAKQTSTLACRPGVRVVALNLATATPAPGVVDAALDRAHVVLVSGGNTLFAVDRWVRTGADAAIKRAVARGCVLTGGSAGALVAFDSGHSDSMDSDSYRDSQLAAFKAGAATGEIPGSDAAGAEPAAKKAWSYVRVSGLGLLRGLCCPHYDRVQSNGVPRAVDLEAMLLRHKGEQAVCIDHNAALVLPGDGTLRVLAVDGRPGSVDGKPGAMLKRVIEVSAAASEGSSEGGGAGAGAARALKVVSEVLPPLGPLAVLLAPMSEPMVEDPRLEAARAENPSTDLVD